MVIQHDISSINVYRNLENNNSELKKDLNKLATGYRINNAGDDAAGLAISEKMRARITGLNRALENTHDGVSIVQYAEAVLQEVHSMLNQMFDLSLQSVNSTYTDYDRKLLEEEHKSLKVEIDRIGESANFNGIKLFDGYDDLSKANQNQQFSIQIGDSFNDYDKIKVILEKMNTKALGISTTTIATQMAAESTAKSMKSAINMLSEDRGNLGAIQNRLMHVEKNIGISIENLIQSESRIRDADMAKVMMDYSKHKIMSETAVSMLAHSSASAEKVLDVVKGNPGSSQTAEPEAKTGNGDGGEQSRGIENYTAMAETKAAASAASGSFQAYS